jgi:multidrug resistance protein, MATE family
MGVDDQNCADFAGQDGEDDQFAFTPIGLAPTPASFGATHGTFNLARESNMLLKIAIPAVAVQFSVLFIFPLTASSVGRTLGTEALAGFSLASLTGNLTILSVMVGALTAADTLMPRAYGHGQYAEVGRLAIRGLVMCSILLIPPLIPLCFSMNWVFGKLGQDATASQLASDWIRVYLLGIPAMLLFRVVQSFLNAQHSVMPMVWAAVVSSFCVHPIVLPIMLHHFGFLGSGLAVSITQTCMAAIILLILKFVPTYKAETWPGLSVAYVKEALAPGPVLTFLALSLGGVFSLSEWWFWETVCFIVGTFGIVPLCVHTIAYNLVPLLFMVPLGISIGLTVRMGNVLAKDVLRAKQMAIWCMALTIVVASIICGFLYYLRGPIVLLFSRDPAVLDGCEAIWHKVCIYVWFDLVFATQSGILRALGMQWRMAAIMFVSLWCATLPTIWYCAIHKSGGIDAVWSVLPVMHAIMNLLLLLSYVTVDWRVIADNVSKEHSRIAMAELEEDQLKMVSEASPLLK